MFTSHCKNDALDIVGGTVDSFIDLLNWRVYRVGLFFISPIEGALWI